MPLLRRNQFNSSATTATNNPSSLESGSAKAARITGGIIHKPAYSPCFAMKSITRRGGAGLKAIAGAAMILNKQAINPVLKINAIRFKPDEENAI